MAYSDLLKDPRWQRRRLDIMNRDKFKCRSCESGTNTLNVHHFSYTGNPWEADDKTLITLCEKCHSLEHSIPTKIMNVFQTWNKSDGILYSDFSKLLIAICDYCNENNSIDTENKKSDRDVFLSIVELIKLNTNGKTGAK